MAAPPLSRVGQPLTTSPPSTGEGGKFSDVDCEPHVGLAREQRTTGRSQADKAPTASPRKNLATGNFYRLAVRARPATTAEVSSQPASTHD